MLNVGSRIGIFIGYTEAGYKLYDFFTQMVFKVNNIRIYKYICLIYLYLISKENVNDEIKTLNLNKSEDENQLVPNNDYIQHLLPNVLTKISRN